MSDRGDYRSWYASILDDPDFHAMEGDVFKLLFALKLTLGAVGIGVIKRLVLMEQLQCTADELEARLATLEEPKADSEFGWIVRDREKNICWLVNGLRFEPNLSSVSAKHQAFVSRMIKPLGARPIVRTFRDYYREWFAGEETAYPSDTPSIDNRSAIDRVSKHSDSDSDGNQATEPSDSGGTSPRDRLIERFYHKASPDRRREVIRQLDQALTPEGVTLSRGVVVKASGPEHLNRCISAVLRGRPPNDPDRAIVFVLKKLGDAETDSRGQTVTEAAAAIQRAADRRLAEWQRARDKAVKAWCEQHPQQVLKIEERAREAVGDNPFALKPKLLQDLTKAAGFPEFDTWTGELEDVAV